MNRLRIGYKEESEWERWLQFTLDTPRFSGSGGYWSEPADLVSFVQCAAWYPLDPDRLPSFSVGGEAEQLAMHVTTTSRTGDLLLTFVISDYDDGLTRLVAAVSLSYAGLERLRLALLAFIRNPDTLLDLELT